MSTPVRTYSLYELVASVRRCIEATYIDQYWVRAETTGLSVNTNSGHCYLELEEKEAGKGIKARIKANIWRNNYEDINRKLRSAGLAPLASGMNILCLVQIKYHELYGMSLIIVDIDPNYSLGEIAKQRQETIQRLKREGVFADNKRYSLPQSIQRLAIISSPTAAGYGDFMDQLRGNSYQLKYYTALYQAQMQGDNASSSIVQALERIARSLEQFDAVVIIRGGGSVSDLRAFDDYQLAYFCTQYPLPIITGIGHDRDVSVLDMVAHTSLKTPTAVAEFLIQQQLEQLQALDSLDIRLRNSCYLIQNERQRRLVDLSLRIPSLAIRLIRGAEQQQDNIRQRLDSLARRRLEQQQQQITTCSVLLPRLLRQQLIQREQHLQLLSTRLSTNSKRHQMRYEQALATYEQAIRLAHPDNILKRGFAIIKQEGKTITAKQQLAQGDKVNIHWIDKEVAVVVEQVSN